MHTYRGEPVPLERWRWIARYSDGTELRQFEGDGTFRRISEIDPSRLDTFRMVSDSCPDGHTLVFDPGSMELVCYAIRGREFLFSDESESEGDYYYYVHYAFGWSPKAGTPGTGAICVIQDDDTVALLNRRP